MIYRYGRPCSSLGSFGETPLYQDACTRRGGTWVDDGESSSGSSGGGTTVVDSSQPSSWYQQPTDAPVVPPVVQAGMSSVLKSPWLWVVLGAYLVFGRGGEKSQ